jgi:branched-chain amino acid transport system permease protein
MPIDIFFQLLINGILFGTMYGIAAIGLSLIFGTMRIVFIAQGTMIILAAYGSFWLFKL